MNLQSGKYVKANGIDIHYGEYGKGQPLIFLHGGTAILDSWDDYAPIFGEHFRMIAPDTRGHGKTLNPTGELNYPLLADDVAAFIQALGLKKPMLFGYSDGGQIALDFGIRYPDVAGALVLGGTLYKFSERYHEALKGLGFPSAGTFDLEYMQKTAPEWVEYMKASHHPDDPDYLPKFLKQVSTLWWTPRDYSDDDLKKIAAPTLVLMGDRDDGIGVEHAAALYRGLPQGEMFIIPNADHGGAGSELANRIVVNFLLRHQAGK
jgi:pimeloyl-ACP methyl ester carboxylesterase